MVLVHCDGEYCDNDECGDDSANKYQTVNFAIQASQLIMITLSLHALLNPYC